VQLPLSVLMLTGCYQLRASWSNALPPLLLLLLLLLVVVVMA
jgi:hypothetical protein